MNVLVDTSIWSLALRRKGAVENDPALAELSSLVMHERVVMIGAVRQELLSGIKQTAQFEKLREWLRAFPDVELATTDYENAAAFFNRCRAKGIQGSSTDFLICAVAAHHDFAIFTADEDFRHFTTVLPIALHPFAASVH